MSFGISFLFTALLALYLFAKFLSFARFYIHARRTGFPVFVSPVPSKSVAWMVLGPILQPQFKKYLPERIYQRLDLVTHGWEFRRKAEIHHRLGKVFALATPDECSLWVADPALGNVILQKRKEFLQAPIVGTILGMFGSNIVQSDGNDWQRQRRIVAPNLNEQVSATVWNESCSQAQDMIRYLVKHPGDSTLSGLRCIAINVIGAAGYGQNQSWSPEFHNLSQGWEDARSAYFKTMALVVDALIEAALLPTKLMKLPFMPRNWQLLGLHKERMPEYTKRVLDLEREAARAGSETRGNLLSMLVRFSDDVKRSGQPGLSLTDDEISGNLFVFSTAGFDTTANTMGYAVMILATHPGWQEWLREELDGLNPDISTWKYEDVFPKCPRTLAVMLETLRLYTPVSHVTRHVAETQQVADDAGTHILTPPMDVYVSAQSMHAEPDFWGPDVENFRPSRWIDTNGQIIKPPKGTYLPWSGGPRICPGMKMSQVEFVATVATLFRSTRCEPLDAGAGKLVESQRRLQEAMDNSSPKLTLQVRDPTQVRLRWVPNRHSSS